MNHRTTLSPDAVVFSSFVPDAKALAVAVEYLAAIEAKFSDCDIYVGINSDGVLAEWISLLEAKKDTLSLQYTIVPPELVVNSDASSFQAALALMKSANKDYRLIWFGHTKGATIDRDEFRRDIIKQFFNKRAKITRKFNNPRAGAYARDITVMPTSGQYHSDINADMDKLYPFKYKGIGTYYLFTFFVLRGQLVKTFLDGCKPAFFDQNLVKDLGYDRWFFEKNFACLAEKMGYYPLYKTRHTHLNLEPVTKKLIRQLYANWEQQLPADKRTRVRLP